MKNAKEGAGGGKKVSLFISFDLSKRRKVGFVVQNKRRRAWEKGVTGGFFIIYSKLFFFFFFFLEALKTKCIFAFLLFMAGSFF